MKNFLEKLSLVNYGKYTKYALTCIATIRIRKTLKEILKNVSLIQARTGEIPTLDDSLQELLNNYKNKSKKN